MKKVLFFIVLFSAQHAFCWSDMGHSIVGALAEANMNSDTKDFVRGILGVEPLEAAAIWPDHVRDDERFGHKNQPPTPIVPDDHNFSDYHFCEIPTGFSYATRPNKTVKDCHGAILGAENILLDKPHPYSHAEKLIALRYLVHIVGDIHQPLHVGNGFDIGANACKIRWLYNDAKPMNMHTAWDDNIVQFLGESYGDKSKKIPGAKFLGDYLKFMRQRHPEMFTASAKAKYGQGTVDQWLEESQSLRESGVYPDAPGSMIGVPKGQEYKNRPYCQWFTDQVNSIIAPGSKIDESRIPTLAFDYANHFAPIVETQLFKAGLRLATILDNIAAQQKMASRLTDQEQESTLSDVQQTFENH